MANSRKPGRKSPPKSPPKSVPSHQRPLNRKPRPTPTGPSSQRETDATRTRGRGRRRRVRREHTNTRSHATAAKKTPSPDNMVLEFDSNLNPSGKPHDKKYSPTKAKAIRDRHNELQELYSKEGYRRDVLGLHTPPSPAWSPGRTREKYIDRVTKKKNEKIEPRYITTREKEIEEGINILTSKKPSNPVISENRIATPEKNQKNQKNKKVKFNSPKRKTPTPKIRSDDLTEERLKHAQDLASEPLSQEVINSRTFGTKTPTSLKKMPRTPISPITMVSTPQSPATSPPPATSTQTYYVRTPRDSASDQEYRAMRRELRSHSRVSVSTPPPPATTPNQYVKNKSIRKHLNDRGGSKGIKKQKRRTKRRR
mgnify:CR=1 FL=1